MARKYDFPSLVIGTAGIVLGIGHAALSFLYLRAPNPLPTPFGGQINPTPVGLAAAGAAAVFCYVAKKAFKDAVQTENTVSSQTAVSKAQAQSILGLNA